MESRPKSQQRTTRRNSWEKFREIIFVTDRLKLDERSNVWTIAYDQQKKFEKREKKKKKHTSHKNWNWNFLGDQIKV